MQLIIVSAATRHLGYKSRSQLYTLINDVLLDSHVHVQMTSWQRLQDLDGLQKTLEDLCQRGVRWCFSSEDFLILAALFLALSAQVF